MLSPDQVAYVERKKLVRLQGYGADALYKTQWGARTVADAMEMEEVQRRYHAKLAEERAKPKVMVKDVYFLRELC